MSLKHFVCRGGIVLVYSLYVCLLSLLFAKCDGILWGLHVVSIVHPDAILILSSDPS